MPDTPGRLLLEPDVFFELHVHVKPTHCDVTSPQLPGASAVGQSDTSAIGRFILEHGARLGVRVVTEESMIVLVIAHTGTSAYEGQLRDGTGPESEMLPGTTVVTGSSEKEVTDAAKAQIPPSLVRRRGIRIEVREDPFQ